MENNKPKCGTCEQFCASGKYSGMCAWQPRPVMTFQDACDLYKGNEIIEESAEE